MKFEPATITNLRRYAYRLGKLQTVVTQFYESPYDAVKLIFDEDEYKSLSVAQSSFCSTIRRLHLPIVARTIKGELYLIKLNQEEVRT